MTPREFANARIAWEELEESRQRSEWERTRLIGVWVLNAQGAKIDSPKKLMTFPWEKTPVQDLKDRIEEAKKHENFKKIFPDRIDGKE